MTPPSKRIWNILTGPTNNDNIDLAFRSFFHLFYRVIEKHAPQKETVLKNKKLELKPWVTTGIKASIKERDKI